MINIEFKMINMRTTTFIFLLLGCMCLNAQSVDCSGAKTGNFTITLGDMVTEIERDEQFQYETMGKAKIKTRVEWTSACSYTLIFVKANKAYYKVVGKDAPTPDISVTITAVDGNTYSIEAAPQGLQAMEFKMVKTK